MGRLPIPGQDNGTWGNILNDYLSAAHKTDGTLKDDAISNTNLQDGAVSEAKLDAALAAKVNTASSGVAPDATTSIKGIVRLQGDLAGTADSPTVPALATKEPTITAGTTSQYYRGDKSFQTLDKTAVGLGNVDNTSDVNKPVSSAVQTALNAKANDNAVAHLTGNETITGIKNFTGTLQAGGNAVVVTNDARLSDQRTPSNASVTPAKLVSDVPVTGEVLSYNGTGFEWITPAAGGGGGEANTASNVGTAGVGVYKQKTGVNIELKKINAASNKVSVVDNTGASQVDLDINEANLTLTKSQVGLGNVDNTADTAKPVSTAQQTALNLKADNSITVTGATSLTGGGNLTANRSLSLVGDSATPGNSKYYGTDGTGTKGYFTLPAGGGDPTMGGDISGTASTAQIVANAVGATEIASNAVTTAKILDANVTEPKLAVSNVPSTSQVLSWNGSAMQWVAPVSGSGGPGSSGYVLVASNDAPAAVKAYADFICTGTNDQNMINSAIDLAAPLQSRNPDMPAGAKQYGKVVLTGGRFNISSAILMRTAVHLSGAGYLTELRSAGCNSAGLIMLADPTDHLCKITDLYLNGGSGGGGTCSAIDFDMTGSNNLTGGYPDVNKDADHLIKDLFIDEFRGTGRHGIYLHATGTANNRGNIIDSIQIRDCTGGNGIYLSAASDSYITNCHVGGSGDAGYRIATGNTKISNCKSFYSVGYGFYFSSGRGVITGCESQDDQVGYMFDGSPYVATGLIADSAGTTAIQVSTDRLVLTGFSIFNRSGGGTGIQFPTTTRGLYFDATYADLMIIGQSDNADITTPIQGTPGARSFMRVSDGTTLVSVGA